MSHNLTELDQHTASVVVPDPGDTTYPLTVPQGMNALANRTHRLNRTLNDIGDDTIDYETHSSSASLGPTEQVVVPKQSRSLILNNAFRGVLARIRYESDRLSTEVTRINAIGQRVPGMFDGLHSGYYGGPPNHIGETSIDDWIRQSAGSTGAPYLLQNSTSSGPVRVSFPWVPSGSTISQVNVWCASPVSHSGSIAGMTMPQVTLCKASPVGTGAPVVTSIGSATDSSANATAFEQSHYISLTGLNETVANLNASYYYLSIRGESGGNAANASFRIYFINVLIQG